MYLKVISKFINNYANNSLCEIKLKDLLELRGSEQALRAINTFFPPTTIGSVTLVDQIVLLCLEELIAPEKILEIGTFQGFTTNLLLSNSQAEKVYSIDLPHKDDGFIDSVDQELLLNDGNYNDDYLRSLQNSSGEVYLKKADISRLVLIKHDSTTLNFKSTIGDVQFAFIDGGHEYSIVKKDTENVESVMSRGVIIWHDFSSNIHSDVTEYLKKRSEKNKIFHVSGSLCAFQFVGI